MLKWLFLGISLIIQINEPFLYTENGHCCVDVETPGLLTDEMKELVTHGVDFEFQLYSSLRYHNAEGENEIEIIRERKKLEFDLRAEEYHLVSEHSFSSFSTLKELIPELENWRIQFPDESAAGYDYDLFLELSLIENELIEGRLGEETAHLWNYYRPTRKMNWEEFN